MPAPTPTPTLGVAISAIRRDASPASSTTVAPTNINTETIQYITILGITDDHVTLQPQTIDLGPTCVQTIAPDANGYVPPGTCGAIWDYYPSFAAALLFAGLFGTLTLLHIWQAARYKKRFCWVIIMAAIWETLAFTFRALSAKHQQSDGIYLVFQIFILLAPLWVNAFDYMVLGRMIYYFLPSRSLFSVPAPIIAALFVSLDFVSFIVQLVGGSTAGPNSSPADQLKAIHVYMGGIGIQQGFIVIFLSLAIGFQMEMSTLSRAVTTTLHPGHQWAPLLMTLYASLALITVRIIFRLIEFSRGDDVSNPILTHEAYFYLLEATPMFFAILSFNITHPGRVLVGPEAEMPGFIATVKGLLRQAKTRQDWKEVDSGDEMQAMQPR
ncbi:RTA1 domain-containing protein [Pleurostoma richardsiae]|uniref:RTA1 domain-containing protein n=1 Tax=Pleurostoma richardsiae TaxID=41990 RepID=A0AA38S5A5_9PEZI|nr:RTA1 domain-containing protein [Pleurostoma richardsiae]